MDKSTSVRTSIFLALAGFINGYDNGVLQWVLGSPNYREYFHGSYPSRHCHTAGYILSAFATFWLADVMGRKKCVFAGACASILGSTLQALSTSTFDNGVGSLVSSFASGILLFSTEVYIAEIAEVRYRGVLIGLLGALLWWGYFVAQWIGYACTHINSNLEWRLPLAIHTIPGLILAAGLWDLQESPVWLMLRDRKDEAREALQKLRQNGMDPTEEISGEYEEMNDTIVPEKSLLGRSLKGLYQKPAWRNKLVLACTMQVLNELSGDWILTIYTLVLLQLVSKPASDRHARLILGMGFSVKFIYSTFGLYLLHRVGRVKVLVLSALACGISLVVNGVLSQHMVGVDQDRLRFKTEDGHQLNINSIRAMIVANVILNFFFVIYHKTSGVYLPEVLPVAIRSRGIAIAAVSRTLIWVLNFEMTARLSLHMYPSIGFKVLYVFAALNFGAAWCYFIFFPETKGKTLSEMEDLFESHVVLSNLESSGTKAPNLSSTEGQGIVATEG